MRLTKEQQAIAIRAANEAYGIAAGTTKKPAKAPPALKAKAYEAITRRGPKPKLPADVQQLPPELRAAEIAGRQQDRMRITSGYDERQLKLFEQKQAEESRIRDFWERAGNPTYENLSQSERSILETGRYPWMSEAPPIPEGTKVYHVTQDSTTRDDTQRINDAIAAKNVERGERVKAAIERDRPEKERIEAVKAQQAADAENYWRRP